MSTNALVPASSSTGPRTDAGKGVSRFNPLRHGLTSQHLILPGESAENFSRLLEGLRTAWRPANPEEECLVAKMAEGEWRMLRARRVETATLKLYMDRILAEEASSNPDYDLALALVYERFGKELDRLRRYETTISRALAKAQRELRDLIAARTSAHPEDVEVEARLTRMEMHLRERRKPKASAAPTAEFVSQTPSQAPAVPQSATLAAAS